jgi:hypothetical protein
MLQWLRTDAGGQGVAVAQAGGCGRSGAVLGEQGLRTPDIGDVFYAGLGRDLTS